jgi:hypothetical protein
MAAKKSHKTQTVVPNLFGFGAILVVGAVVLFFVLQMVMNKDVSMDSRSEAAIEQKPTGDILLNLLVSEANSFQDLPVGGEEE